MLSESGAGPGRGLVRPGDTGDTSAAGEREHQLTPEGPAQAAQLEALGKTLEFALVLLS